MAFCSAPTQAEAAQQAAASGRWLQVMVSRAFVQNLVLQRVRCFVLLVLLESFKYVDVWLLRNLSRLG